MNESEEIIDLIINNNMVKIENIKEGDFINFSKVKLKYPETFPYNEFPVKEDGFTDISKNIKAHGKSIFGCVEVNNLNIDCWMEVYSIGYRKTTGFISIWCTDKVGHVHLSFFGPPTIIDDLLFTVAQRANTPNYPSLYGQLTHRKQYKR